MSNATCEPQASTHCASILRDLSCGDKRFLQKILHAGVTKVVARLLALLPSQTQKTSKGARNAEQLDRDLGSV